jgi:hypothetical protein
MSVLWRRSIALYQRLWRAETARLNGFRQNFDAYFLFPTLVVVLEVDFSFTEFRF